MRKPGVFFLTLSEPKGVADRIHELQMWADYYRATQTWDQAEQSYQRILNLAPDHTGAYVGLGLIAMAQGHYDEAIEMWNHATEIDPVYATPYGLRGALFLNYLGQPAKALPEFKRYLELSHRPDATTLVYLGRAYMLLGDYESAIRYLGQLVTLQPEKAESWCLLGSGYYELGNLKQAKEMLDQALSRMGAQCGQQCQYLDQQLAEHQCK